MLAASELHYNREADMPQLRPLNDKDQATRGA